MKTFRVAVSQGGRIDYLDHGQLNLDGKVRRRRASHIVPVGFWLRAWFRLVRLVARDESTMAAWTRTWRTPWSVDLRPSGGPMRGPFVNRRLAVQYEEEWLAENVLGAEQCTECCHPLLPVDGVHFWARRRVCLPCLGLLSGDRLRHDS